MASSASSPATVVSHLRGRPPGPAQPGPGRVADHLPIAVGFGSTIEISPRLLWVVPGAPAEVEPLPALLDGGPAGRPLRLAPPARRPDGPGPDRVECDSTAFTAPIDVVRDLSGSGHPAGRGYAVAEREPTPLRLTARGRAALLIMAGLIGGAVVVVAWFGAGTAHSPARAAHPAQVVVHAGDTLWSIAGRVAPGHDPRAIIDQLRRLNRLGSPDLIPGQVLRTR